MMPRTLRLAAILVLAHVTAFADGGMLEFRRNAGGYALTVFTSPAPLSAGPVDISVLVQNRNGLDPVLDAEVWLLVEGIRVQATREQAQNKILYAAPVTLTQPGKSELGVEILRSGERVDAEGTVEVAASQGVTASYWSYVTAPPLLVALFVIRERLVRRKLKGC